MPETNPTPTTTTPQPDLSAMSQAGPAAVSAPTPQDNAPLALQSQGTQGAVNAATEPIQRGGTPAPQSAPAGPPPPHARLLSMVQGLADGLAGFSAGLASKGKVSGAEVVQNLEGERAAQQQRAVAATQAQKDAELRNKLTSAETNDVVAKTHGFLGSLQDEMSLKHTQAQDAGLGLQQKAQEIFDTTGRIPTGWSADPNTGQVTQGKPATSAVPVAGTPAAPSMYDRRAGYILDAMGKELADDKGNEDPAVIAARKVFADPASTIEQKQQTLVSLQQRAGMNAQVIKNLTEKADLAAKQQTGAQGAIKTEQEQLAQNTYNRTVPRNSAGQPTEDFATWQARSTKEAEVKAQQGDPTALGEMAADGLITIPQIAIARQLDKKGFQTLLAAADNKAKANGVPEIVINGKGTGHYFNANAATQQYDYVKEFNNPNSKNQQSINSGSTFMEHMADLLDTNAQYARTNATILNTPLNKIEKTFGGTTYTKLMAAIAPVKTEYDNALKAGFAPTSEDAKTVDLLLQDNATPAQIETAGKTMVHTILRRLNSTNEGYKTHTGGVDYPNMITPDAASALQKMGIDASGLQSGGSFGGTPQAGVTAGKTQSAAPRTPPAGVPAGSKLMQAPGGTPHWMSPDKIAAAQKLGATEVQ